MSTKGHLFKDNTNHPCFNKEAAGTFGRVHLPVAPKCNVQCNFCNRDYDCVNESRPGVTSKILSPGQALWYFEKMSKKINISVAGIAGPGDPFADPGPTLETMRLIREKYPEMLLCVSSNGLNLLSSVPELAELNVSHVTITINAIDPRIGEEVYSWIRPGKRSFRGIEGASLLLENQFAALAALKAHGITVKINSIVIPGVNENHITAIAEETAQRGADLFNCIPMMAVKGTVFEHLGEPDHNMMSGIKAAAGKFLPQMKHCQRCRADAAGLLGDKGQDYQLQVIGEAAAKPLDPYEERPYIAAVSREGFLVNQHLGEAEEVGIYTKTEEGRVILLERRKAPPAGMGDSRWESLAECLRDCRGILVNGIGSRPKMILEKKGLKPHLVEGLLFDAVEKLFSGESLDTMSCRFKGCGTACTGNGGGCG